MLKVRSAILSGLVLSILSSMALGTIIPSHLSKREPSSNGGFIPPTDSSASLTGSSCMALEFRDFFVILSDTLCPWRVPTILAAPGNYKDKPLGSYYSAKLRMGSVPPRPKGFHIMAWDGRSTTVHDFDIDDKIGPFHEKPDGGWLFEATSENTITISESQKSVLDFAKKQYCEEVPQRCRSL